MKKIIITAVICILCFSLCSCAAGGGRTSAKTESLPPETSLKAESGADTGTDSGADGQEEILNGYLERFGADTYYRDAFIDYKYFILNGSELVYLLALPGVEQTTVVPLDSVARVEQIKTGTFTVVTVYDRTGASVSIDLDGEKAAELVRRIG